MMIIRRTIGAAVLSPRGPGLLKVSTLTNGFDRTIGEAERPELISAERKAQLKRIALRALAVLTMGGIFAAFIALKTAIYVWHLQA
jgi:hypothetical protein